MNQPDLGHYISNLRKEQGLTQEELVERCNINVRTIQRIEAGEVTPRSYTVKNILEALGSSFDDVFKKKSPVQEPPHPLEKNKTFLVYAIIAGVIYFIASSLEIWADTSFSFTQEQELQLPTYILIKSISLLAGSIFFFGAYITGKEYKSPMIKFSALSFIIICLILGTVDGFIYVHDLNSHTAYYLGRLVIFGLLYAFLGAGFFLKRQELGDIGKWTGLCGLIGGLCLLTIILVIPGIIFYVAFELLLILFFYQQWAAIKSKKLQGN
jgi:transcriptional regulator with XRE-family HTH domain